jgi:hypothetical protein
MICCLSHLQHNARGFLAKISDLGMMEMFTREGPMMGGLGGTVTHVAPEAALNHQVRTP